MQKTTIHKVVLSSMQGLRIEWKKVISAGVPQQSVETLIGAQIHRKQWVFEKEGFSRCR